jgi:L-threonylcarbamoyladenylate synthase
MKYKHYAPKATVVLVERPTVARMAHARALYKGSKVRVFGARELSSRNLYARLRESDKKGFDVLIVPAVSERGVGLAIMNRLRKAASRVIA